MLGISDKAVSLPNQILEDPIYENTLNLCFAHDGGFMEFGREHIPQNLIYTPWHKGSNLAFNCFWAHGQKYCLTFLKNYL